MGDSTNVDPLVQFWDRPPDVIHAELGNPRRMLGSRPVRDLGWMGSHRDYGFNLENYWNGGAPQPQERCNFVMSTQRIAF